MQYGFTILHASLLCFMYANVANKTFNKLINLTHEVTFETCNKSLFIIPAGTKRERGIIAWNKAHQNESDNTLESDVVYGLPFGINNWLSSFTWTKYVPFCPTHKVSRQDDTPYSLDSLDTKTEPNKDDTHIIAGVAL